MEKTINPKIIKEIVCACQKREKKIVNDQAHKTILSLRWIAQTLDIQCARDNDVRLWYCLLRMLLTSSGKWSKPEIIVWHIFNVILSHCKSQNQTILNCTLPELCRMGWEIFIRRFVSTCYAYQLCICRKFGSFIRNLFFLFLVYAMVCFVISQIGVTMSWKECSQLFAFMWCVWYWRVMDMLGLEQVGLREW